MNKGMKDFLNGVEGVWRLEELKLSDCGLTGELGTRLLAKAMNFMGRYCQHIFCTCDGDFSILEQELEFFERLESLCLYNIYMEPAPMLQGSGPMLLIVARCESLKDLSLSRSQFIAANEDAINAECEERNIDIHWLY
eukprot:Platyproteum_vivax@DN6859_c0_g1_i1.p1